MTDRRQLLPALRAADARLRDERVGAAANHRIARRLAAELHPSPVRRWLPALAFAAGAAVTIAAIGLQLSGPSVAAPALAAPGTAPAPALAVAGFTVPDPDCARPGHDVEAGRLELDGACRATPGHGRLEIQTFADERASVSAAPTGVDLHRGRALFDVNRAAPDSPVHIRVPGGTIEVFGTKFFVSADDAGGHVDLIEGKIRFVHGDGSVSRVAPGERFAWSLAPVVAEAPGVPEPVTSAKDRAPSRPRARRMTSTEVDRTIARVQELRRDRRYADAAGTLRRALRRRLEPRAREVLSYELGDLLTRQLDDRARACDHWTGHQARFPDGRYTRAVDRAMTRLDCG